MDEVTQLKIQGLTYARRKIEQGVSTYICYALGSYYASQIRLGENAGQTAYLQLVEHIQEEIAPYTYYQNWLSSQSSDYHLLDKVGCRRAAKEGRLAWIDYMLNQLQKDTRMRPSREAKINQLKIKIQILQLARNQVAAGRFPTLCSAIVGVIDKISRIRGGLIRPGWEQKRPEYIKAGREIREYIMGKLGRHVLYTQWINEKRPETRKLNSRAWLSAARIGRVQWANYMIQQLENALVKLEQG